MRPKRRAFPSFSLSMSNLKSHSLTLHGKWASPNERCTLNTVLFMRQKRHAPGVT